MAAVDNNNNNKSFTSLLNNQLDPWRRRQILPPKPWESIHSESGPSSRTPLNPQSPLYDTSSVSEASLVRLSLNALQGLESSLVSIHELSAAFSSDPVDRTVHRIPSLWNQSLSTLSLGKILISIGRSGCCVFLLRKFVDYFLHMNFGDVPILEQEKASSAEKYQTRELPPYSLVNQAFAVAIGKVLEGYISALDTLSSSVILRRSSNVNCTSANSSSRVGCLSSVGHSEVTLLEVYLHTKVLRTQIDALGCICGIHGIALCFSQSPFEDLKSKMNFSSFPRGGDLLTHLYTQLKVADPAHHTLLKILFLHSCEPYIGFIRSWIFNAKISDPFEEFVVSIADNQQAFSMPRTGHSFHFPSATIREERGAVTPCFLRNSLIPLFRAGLQLQVLMKLLELCVDVGIWNRTFEDCLPNWSGMSSSCSSDALTFSKKGIEERVISRNKYYKCMMEKLDNQLTSLELRYQQMISPRNLPASAYNSGRNLGVSTATDGGVVPLRSSPNKRMSIRTFCDSSSTTEFSLMEETLDSSEYSSLSSSEDEAEDQSEKQAELLRGIPYKKYLSALNFNSNSSLSALRKSSQNEVLCPKGNEPCETSGKTDLASYLWHFNLDGPDSNDTLPLQCDHSLAFMSETQDLSGRHASDLEVDGLPSSGLYLDKGNGTWLTLPGSRFKSDYMTTGVGDNDGSHFSDLNFSDINLREMASNMIHSNGNSLCSKLWKAYNPNFFCANPMLTNNSFTHIRNEVRESSRAEYVERLPFLDFTSVKDPFEACADKLAVTSEQQIGNELAVPFSFDIFTRNNSHQKEDESCDEISFEYTKSSVCPIDMKSNHEEVSLPSASGGNGWETLLGSSFNDSNINIREHQYNVAEGVGVPLDFLIEKCLLEEIQLQYSYVSKLTIKLLEEGFNLQEHFWALRQYHLMESADWADLFIMSLWHHKWYVTEADKRISEIQGLLELSVQRSSCERDHNKGRLYVYMKEQDAFPLESFATGIHSFDVLGLGYRVDWPVSIVLTPRALKIYADIFSFLIQVKLALSSVTEVWCRLKELKHMIYKNDHYESHESEIINFNIVLKLRQQVNHFVSTLQQYVQSQLSHVSWCKFLHSLKHKVKDMLDLETVHMNFLNDSLRICFLSKETQLVASIVQNILQCAVDFRSFLIGSDRGSTADGSASKPSQTKAPQILPIKEKFDKNIKDLYLCYLKSAKNEEFGLPRFWEFLNYNDYYAEG